jgi:hypothetical protein
MIVSSMKRRESIRTVEMQSVEHVEAAFDEKVLGSVGGGVGSIFEDGKDTSHQFAIATPAPARHVPVHHCPDAREHEPVLLTAHATARHNTRSRLKRRMTC